MSAATASYDTSNYIILGHGSELLVEIDKRPTIPAGYTLVLFTQCGATSDFYGTVSKLIHLFHNSDMKETLSSPTVETLKRLIDEEIIHIFTEGSSYPPLTAQLFLDWDIPSNRSKQRIVKAGMYKFPLEGDANDYLESRIIETNTGTARSFTDIPSVKKLYEHAVYPSEAIIDDVLSTRQGTSVLAMRTNKVMNIPLEKLFEVGGPGVYYWPICRSLHNRMNLTNYLDPLDSYMYKINRTSTEYKNLESIKNRYKPYLATWLNSYPTISKYMNENATNERIREKTRGKMIAARAILNAEVGHVGRIRAGSINQQTKKIGGRRTIRHKNRRAKSKTRKHSSFKL